MSIVSVTGFLTASLVLVGIALAVLVLSVGVAGVQFFGENRRIRVARREPVLGYYRHLVLS